MITSYSELKTQIASWVNRSDFDSVIPVFIQLAEKQLKRKLRIREMIRTASLTAVDSTATVALSGATGFVEVIHAQLADSDRTLLQYLQPSSLFTHSNATTEGTPKYFTIATNSSDEEIIHLRPVPVSNTTFEFTYYAFDDLSTSNASNIILAKHPEIYLYLSLANTSSYLVDDERVALWANLAQVAMTEVMRESEQAFYGQRRNVRYSNDK
jgi:hypothetical protein